ncbi:4-vinyl reductase [candidate division KSB3 bacterium]|uniref:4-vinyl reductase n=1 Tax=candidate division KSB3 bacterium TaxID=2044937 RepID=A0A2G6KH87_9BACT|nr:MAG: 4-vinyl reductase [candidate division KSB3 bacterium]
MFKEERTESTFDWNMIGDIKEGRPNLGTTTHVAVYRLMQFTLRDALIAELGTAKTDEIFYSAGEKAGREYYKNIITRKDSFDDFIDDLQESLKTLRIAILRIEDAEFDKMAFSMTLAEDLDCSGLPMCNEEICTYDEGFISGLLSEHTGRNFKVKEVDCWCSGDRVCRFEVKPG